VVNFVGLRSSAAEGERPGQDGAKESAAGSEASAPGG